MYQFTTHYVGDDSGVVIDPGAGWLLIHAVSLSPQRIACIWEKPDAGPLSRKEAVAIGVGFDDADVDWGFDRSR